MGTRDDFDDFFGDDEDPPVVDTRADGRLYRVPLGRLTPNLVNPRTDFGTEDQLIDFGKSLTRRQNQPCPVVSRGAYLKLWPDHADRIGDVDYVLVSGERRYRAATAVGLAALDCVADDNTAADRRTFMEAVVSENVDRRNFDPVEEAYAVQSLVQEFGSNRAVAQHFERVDGWVTQRVLLTHLAREVQDLVRRKTMPLEAARTLGRLAREKQWQAQEQLAWWEEEQERRAAASAARKAARRQPRQEAPAAPAQPAPREQREARPEPESFTAVKPTPASAARPGPREGTRGDPPARTEAPATAALPPRPDVPRPTGEAPPGPGEQSGEQHALPPTLPYTDPPFLALHLDKKMSDDYFFDLVRLVNAKALERDPQRLRSLVKEVADG